MSTKLSSQATRSVRWLTVGDVLDEAAYGTSTKASDTENGVPVLRMGNVRYDGSLDLGDLKYVSLPPKELSKHLLREGDILFNRTNSRDLVGKTGLWDGRFDAVAASYFVRLRVNRRIVMPEYLWLYMNSPGMKRRLFATARGAIGQANINTEELRGLPIPLPPLPEQRRIVDILNRANGIRRLRREAQEKARQVILALFVEMFGDPANSTKWERKPLSAVVRFAGGGTPARRVAEYWGGGIPWVSAKDMKPDPIISSEETITPAALDNSSTKLIPENSVLVVLRGMILAHTVPIRLNATPVAINQDLKALIPNDCVHAVYLRWALQAMHHHLLGQVSTAAHGTKKLDMERLKAIELPCPPLSLQQAFASHVADLQSIIARQDRAALAEERLVHSLMARMFQDSDYGGRQQLLEGSAA